jgi:hypothetical protein
MNDSVTLRSSEMASEILELMSVSPSAIDKMRGMKPEDVFLFTYASLAIAMINIAINAAVFVKEDLARTHDEGAFGVEMDFFFRVMKTIARDVGAVRIANAKCACMANQQMSGLDLKDLFTKGNA